MVPRSALWSRRSASARSSPSWERSWVDPTMSVKRTPRNVACRPPSTGARYPAADRAAGGAGTVAPVRGKGVLVSFGVWTLFVWATRVGTAWNQDDLSAAGRAGRVALALSFTAF